MRTAGNGDEDVLCTADHTQFKRLWLRWAELVIGIGEGNTSFTVLMGHPSRRKPMGRYRNQ